MYYTALHIEDSYTSTSDTATLEIHTLELTRYESALEFVEQMRLEPPDWHEIALQPSLLTDFRI